MLIFYVIDVPGPGQYRAQTDFGFYDPVDIMPSVKLAEAGSPAKSVKH